MATRRDSLPGLAPERLLQIAMLLLLAVVCGVAIRLLYGADLTDETFYAVLARRFAQGDVPFRDDWTSLQLSGFAVSPFVRAWDSLWGTEGLILGLRWGYLVMNVAVGASILPWLARAAGRAMALGAVAAYLSLVPFLIPALSYNTIAISMLALGISAGLSLLLGARRPAFVSGLAFSFAAFVYPTLAVAAAAAFFMLRLWVPDRTVMRMWLLGAAPAVALAALVLLRAGDGLGQTYSYLAANQGYLGGWQKLLAMGRGALGIFFRQPAFWLCLVVVGLRLIIRRPLPPWVAPVVLLSAAFPMLQDSLYASVVAPAMLLGAAIVSVLIVGSAELDSLERWVFGLGGIAAVLTAYTSSNGALNLGIGALGALPATLTLVGRRLRLVGYRWADAAVVGVCFAIAAASLSFAFSRSYRDAPPADLAVRVTSGPFAGLRTTPQRARYLERVTTFARRETSARDRIAAYPESLVVYLVSDGRMGTPNAWISRVDEQKDVFRLVGGRLMSQQQGPTVVIRDMDASRQAALPSFDELTDAGFNETARSEHLIVYRRPGSAAW